MYNFGAGIQQKLYYKQKTEHSSNWSPCHQRGLFSQSLGNCICIIVFVHLIFFTFVSCLLTVTLHIVDVRLTCLINITYLLT